MQKVLGISAFYHDSAAALVIGGKIIAAAQEERFTREKHTRVFPFFSIKYCLEEAGLEINELDAIVFYDKPLLKFERLLQTYYEFAPKGLFSFIKAIPGWINEKLFFKKLIYDNLRKIEEYDKKKFRLLFSEHHLSHAASAFFVSPFQKSAILTIDGVGEWCTASIALGDQNDIRILKEMEFPHSVGLLYSAFTYFLGFTVNSGEYKLMGLAPYGNPTSEVTSKFINIIRENLIDIKEDGSVWLNQSYFGYSTSLKMIKVKKWETLFGILKREPETELMQIHCDLAYAIQHITEEIITKMAIEAKRITGCEDLCLAGGVALNCVANGKLIQDEVVNNIFVQPAAGDAGGAIGAALAVSHLYFDVKREIPETGDSMHGAFLGPEFSDKEIQFVNRKTKATSTYYPNFSELSELIAEKIADGNVVGWFQGRMEFGPRALGNRSILGDPRNPEMQKKLNLKVKYREGFRPFAPAVLAENASEYFKLYIPSPYMLLVAPVQDNKRNILPADYADYSLWEKLYFIRSELPAITHLDYSARIQTVHKETNQRFWELLTKFKSLTGCSVLVNTSFNVRGEPIVCSPFDAYRCFMNTEIDYLVIGNFLYKKTEQIGWENREKWNIKFKMD